MPRVLLICNDATCNNHLQRCFLEDAEFAVDCATRNQWQSQIDRANYDLLVLDLLTAEQSLPVLQLVRKLIATPILIAGQAASSSAKAELLNQGADDYQVLPIDAKELIARSRAIIRRNQARERRTLKWSDVELHPANQSFTRGGQRVDLTVMEYRLLEYLAHHPNTIVSKKQIVQELYGNVGGRNSNVIEVYVSGLRRKLNDNSIMTVRGRGYFLQAADVKF